MGGLVYGFDKNLDKNYSSQEIFKLASACGTVKVVKEGSKPPSKDQIHWMMNGIVMEKMNR